MKKRGIDTKMNNKKLYRLLLTFRNGDYRGLALCMITNNCNAGEVLQQITNASPAALVHLLLSKHSSLLLQFHVTSDDEGKVSYQITLADENLNSETIEESLEHLKEHLFEVEILSVTPE